ncbi:hypothetical protein D3C86_2230370 [compost metagenome]
MMAVRIRPRKRRRRRAIAYAASALMKRLSRVDRPATIRLVVRNVSSGWSWKAEMKLPMVGSCGQ